MIEGGGGDWAWYFTMVCRIAHDVGGGGQEKNIYFRTSLGGGGGGGGFQNMKGRIL